MEDDVKEEEEEEKVVVVVDVNGDDGAGGAGGGGGGGGGEAEEVVRVLVVDDSPVDRRVVEMLLKRSGCMFEVISVSTAKKAMEVLGLNDLNSEPSSDCNDQNIDVILTDYCMPEMTGYDLLKAVKDHSSSKPIPVFIMSSENDPQRISSCQAIGAEDFLLKPLKKNDVLRLRNSTITLKLNPPPKAGSKRKLPVDMIAEKSSSGSRPRLTKVAVA